MILLGLAIPFWSTPLRLMAGTVQFIGFAGIGWGILTSPDQAWDDPPEYKPFARWMSVAAALVTLWVVWRVLPI